ncbi:hypothetical protein EE612_008196, partial [Oryza sativa]
GEKLQKQRPEEIGSSGQTTRENHHRPKEISPPMATLLPRIVKNLLQTMRVMLFLSQI